MEIWRGTHDDAWDAAQRDLDAHGLTDGLPVIPPTARRVGAMLEAVAVDPAEVLGVLPPAFAEITWRDAAINAVMAGCDAAYLPVVGAALAGMAAPEFNLLGI